MLNWQQNLHWDFPQRWKVKSSQLWMTNNHIITESETDMLLFFKHLALLTQIPRTHRKGLRTVLYECTSEMDECKNMEMPKKGLKWEMTGILHLHEAEQTHNPHPPPTDRPQHPFISLSAATGILFPTEQGFAIPCYILFMYFISTTVVTCNN